LGLAMIFTKHIVGPIKALVIHIDALKNGNYDFNTTLRRDDDLVPLMIALNELSDVLKQRHARSEFPLDKTGTH
jgi:nitrogen fixation/metabolism regulation signal transduction histidine kinase